MALRTGRYGAQDRSLWRSGLVAMAPRTGGYGAQDLWLWRSGLVAMALRTSEYNFSTTSFHRTECSTRRPEFVYTLVAWLLELNVK